ncbi:MAG: hypothetical protein NWF07_07485 [Candidatus Bathyarchaeota archaeon]|nr:hypothetical protein [Candidatus Bathyarchaeota archaeon]
MEEKNLLQWTRKHRKNNLRVRKDAERIQEAVIPLRQPWRKYQ